jgi:hypothetical protein
MNFTDNSEEQLYEHEGLIFIYAMATIYFIGIILAVFGNAAVLLVIFRLICYSKDQQNFSHVYIYIFCLSFTDFFYALVNGPATVLQILTNHFPFGLVACKAMFTLEGLNKTFSIYALVILSGDRYLAVNQPTAARQYRNTRIAIYVISVAFLICIPVIIPLMIYSDLSINHPHPDSGYNETLDNYICTLCFDTQTLYVPVLLIFYFILPLVLLLYFYSAILWHLRNRNRQTQRNRITKIVSLVVICHLICWCPYWFLQVCSWLD